MKTKKEGEQDFFERFKKLWDDYPNNYQIQFDESPDVILKAKGLKTIGIEITELIHIKDKNQDYSVAQNYDLETKIVKMAKEVFLFKNHIPLHLRINFQQNFNCRDISIEILAKEIAQIVEEETREFDLKKTNQFLRDDPLPNQLVQIRAFYVPEVGDSVWVSLQAKFLPDIDNNQVEKLIIKKSELITKYKQKSELIYLIIVEGRIPLSWFNNLKDWGSSKFTSNFDKVFLLRIQENKLVEL